MSRRGRRPVESSISRLGNGEMQAACGAWKTAGHLRQRKLAEAAASVKNEKR